MLLPQERPRDPIELNERRAEKKSLQEALLRATQVAQLFFSIMKENLGEEGCSQITIEEVLNFMCELGVFSELDESSKTSAMNIVEGRVALYLLQIKTVDSYRRVYQNDLRRLLTECFQKTATNLPGRFNAIWELDCVTIVVGDKVFNALTRENGQKVKPTDGQAYLDGSALNLCRSTDWEQVERVHAHERRHQRSQFLMRNKRSHLDSAQEEILSFMEEDYDWLSTLKELIEPNHTYDHFTKRKLRANTPGKKSSVELAWRKYCRRAAKGIQMAIPLGKAGINDLSLTPLSQWRKRLNQPPSDDFFFLPSRATPEDLEPRSPNPLEAQITAIFRDPKNRELVNRAGLAEPDTLKNLLPYAEYWHMEQTPSGILIFWGDPNTDLNMNIVLIPSVTAIHEVHKTHQNL